MDCRAAPALATARQGGSRVDLSRRSDRRAGAAAAQTLPAARLGAAPLLDDHRQPRPGRVGAPDPASWSQLRRLLLRRPHRRALPVAARRAAGAEPLYLGGAAERGVDVAARDG